MGSALRCFWTAFDKSDTGLIAHRKGIDPTCKYHVALHREQHGPSASLIRICFVDTTAATAWFTHLRQCASYEMIKIKPKTELWQEGRYIYYTQSYYDHDRKILNTVLSRFKASPGLTLFLPPFVKKDQKSRCLFLFTKTFVDLHTKTFVDCFCNQTALQAI